MTTKPPSVCLKHAVRICFPDGTNWIAQKGTQVTLIPHQFVFESLNSTDWRDLNNGTCRDMPVPGSIFLKERFIRVKIGNNIIAQVDIRALHNNV